MKNIDDEEDKCRVAVDYDFAVSDYQSVKNLQIIQDSISRP